MALITGCLVLFIAHLCPARPCVAQQLSPQLSVGQRGRRKALGTVGRKMSSQDTLAGSSPSPSFLPSPSIPWGLSSCSPLPKFPVSVLGMTIRSEGRGGLIMVLADVKDIVCQELKEPLAGSLQESSVCCLLGGSGMRVTVLQRFSKKSCASQHVTLCSCPSSVSSLHYAGAARVVSSMLPVQGLLEQKASFQVSLLSQELVISGASCVPSKKID